MSQDDRPVPFPQADPGDDWTPWPVSLKSQPTTIKDLIGLECRIIQGEEKDNPKVNPGTVTIFLTEDFRIADVVLHLGRPTI